MTDLINTPAEEPTGPVVPPASPEEADTAPPVKPWAPGEWTAAARSRGDYADYYRQLPLEHDCESTDYEPRYAYVAEHRARAEWTQLPKAERCQFAYECNRLYRLERTAAREREDAAGEDDIPAEPDDGRRWAIYRLTFVKSGMFYAGRTDDVWRRFKQHAKRSHNTKVRALVESGDHFYPEVIVDGLVELEHAIGAEEALIRSGLLGPAEKCLNVVHHPSRSRR